MTTLQPASPASQGPLPTAKRFSRSTLWILALLLAGFVLRVWYLHAYVTVFETEGAQSARMADNLLHGRGFESILYPSVDLEHCWLQPILIAAIASVSRNSEVASHILSLIAGTLLPLVLFLLADRLYGRRAAWIAAGFAAFHPVIVGLSASGYAEALAMSLQFAATYWTLKMMEADGRWSWLISGALWGLSYLHRTECLVLPFLAVAVMLPMWLRTHETLRGWALASARFLAIFAIFPLAYGLFFYQHSGKFRFEGKNLLNYTIGQRVLEGMPPGMATRGIDDQLRELGPHLHTNDYFTYSPYPSGFRDLLRYFVRNASRNKYWLISEIPTAPYFGSIALFFLAFLGLLAKPWNQTRFFRELYLIGLFGYFIVLLLAAHIRIPRYAFILLPFLFLWAAAGVDWLMEWVSETAASLRVAPAWSARMAFVPAAVAVAIVLTISWATLPYLEEFSMAWAPHDIVKDAGEWLRSQAPGLKTSMGTNEFAYYSYSYRDLFPYADSATALRYLHKKKPDYLYLSTDEDLTAPYYRDWMEKGIPDPAATLIYDRRKGELRAVIYKWNP
jgi:4-amino-4-deoxy-L-arabinose transferase-like glycosyltransferase